MLEKYVWEIQGNDSVMFFARVIKLQRLGLHTILYNVGII
jgi:hypothetical protein